MREEKRTPHHTFLPSTTPRFQPFNYGNVTKEAFDKNELVYTCIQRIHSAFVEAPLRIFDEDDVIVPNSGLEVLMQKPNPFQSYVEFTELTFIYFVLSGNAFWEKVRNAAGQVVELWPLRPDLVQIFPDKEKFVKGYAYTVGEREYPIAVEDMIHFKWGGATEQLFGTSPLKSAFRQIDTDNEATDTTKVVFENGAFPFVVIKTQEEIDAAKSKRLTARWMNKFGRKQRGKPAFLQSGMEVETLSIKLNDLLFPDLRDITETRILGVLGVPPIIAGTKVGLTSATYSNASEFRKFFFDQTINPLYKRFESKIKIDLLPEFATHRGQSARYDTTRSSFLQDAHFKRQDQANRLVLGGWVKINEGRRMIGLPPDPKQDGYLRVSSSVFIPADGSTPKPSMPPAPPAIRSPRDIGGSPNPKPPKVGKATELSMALDRVEYALQYVNELQSAMNVTLSNQSVAIAKCIEDFDMHSLEEHTEAIGLNWPMETHFLISDSIRGIITASFSSAIHSLGMSSPMVLDPDEDTFVKQFTLGIATELCQEKTQELSSLLHQCKIQQLSESEIKESVLTLKDAWWNGLEKRVQFEAIKASNAGTLLGYQMAGVSSYEWVTIGDSCALCKSMDGEKINMGESFTVEGKEVHHPPLHLGCNAVILAI